MRPVLLSAQPAASFPLRPDGEEFQPLRSTRLATDDATGCRGAAPASQPSVRSGFNENRGWML